MALSTIPSVTQCPVYNVCDSLDWEDVLSDNEHSDTLAHAEISRLTQLLAQRDVELSQKDAELAQKETEISFYDAELARKDIELDRKNAELDRKDAELAQRDAELERKNAELAQKDAELAQKDAELARKNAELDRKNAELDRKNAELTQKNAPLDRKNAERLQLLFKTWKDAYNEETVIKKAYEADIVAYDKVYAMYEEFQSVVGGQPHIGYFGAGAAKRRAVLDAENVIKKQKKAYIAAIDATKKAEKAYKEAKAVEKA
jgi:uncharacterized protein (DUF3084 family)